MQQTQKRCFSICTTILSKAELQNYYTLNEYHHDVTMCPLQEVNVLGDLQEWALFVYEFSAGTIYNLNVARNLVQKTTVTSQTSCRNVIGQDFTYKEIIFFAIFSFSLSIRSISIFLELKCKVFGLYSTQRVDCDLLMFPGVRSCFD